MTAHPSSRPPPAALLGGPDHEAVVVAMIVAPGVYARNRMFDFFRTAAAQRARKRAATVRGVVGQLGRAVNVTVTEAGADRWTLRYAIDAIHFFRTVELTSAEIAALRVACERANVHTLPAIEGDKDLVAKSLAKLMLDE